jgi:hypothetical protein
MKFNMLFLSIILVFASCSTKDDIGTSSEFTRNVNDSSRIYTDLSGTSVTITNSVWFTSTTNSNSFGQVNLGVTGSTNADKITVMMYGDGVQSEENISLNALKSFKNDTVVISFTHFSNSILPTTEIEKSTMITAYKGSDTLRVVINSGKLRY